MTSTTQHIILDLDGTLIDSKAEIIKTYQLVIKEIVPAQMPDFNQMNYGATLKVAMDWVYPGQPETAAKARALFASLYDTSLFEETTLYESVPETLSLLHKHGHALYVATNKRYTPTIRILQQKRIDHFFRDVMASEMTPGANLSKEGMIASLKERNKFTEGFMVGDTSSDIQAGNKQKLKTVAVSYGYEGMETLEAEGPTFVIESFGGLMGLV